MDEAKKEDYKYINNSIKEYFKEYLEDYLERIKKKSKERSESAKEPRGQYNKDEEIDLFKFPKYTTYFILFMIGLHTDKIMPYKLKDVWQKHYKKHFLKYQIIKPTLIAHRRGDTVEEYAFNWNSVIKRIDKIIEADLDNVVKNTTQIKGKKVAQEYIKFLRFSKIYKQQKELITRLMQMYFKCILENKKIEDMDTELRHFIQTFDKHYLQAYDYNLFLKYAQRVDVIEGYIRTYTKIKNFHPAYIIGGDKIKKL